MTLLRCLVSFLELLEISLVLTAYFIFIMFLSGLDASAICFVCFCYVVYIEKEFDPQILKDKKYTLRNIENCF